MSQIKLRLAKNIRLAREQKGLSRPQLAELAGCHKNTLYQYEHAGREVDSETLEKLAGILRDGNWLWFYQDQDHSAEQSPPPVTPPQVAHAAALDEEQRAEIRRIVESVWAEKQNVNVSSNSAETSLQIGNSTFVYPSAPGPLLHSLALAEFHQRVAARTAENLMETKAS